MSIQKENLDERIERIKRQAEEIEKKHREAEEDRLMALKMNALVTKSTLDDENWPKAHKYDELDFTYDVDPEKLEESNKAKEEEMLKPKRDYKKFAEGEGPPPDPKYNFLADNERDRTGQQNFPKNDKFKQNQSINGNSNNNNNSKNKDQFNKRGGSQNNSFRGGRSIKGQSQQQTQFSQSLNQNKTQSKNPQPEQWRNINFDKGAIDEKFHTNRNQNLKSNDKYKREWDNDKSERNNFSQEPVSTNRSPKHTAIKNVPNFQNQTNNMQQNHYVQQHNNSNSQAEYMIEKRGNITVSVSQTGEVKSVKLSSAPAIGTGRVGPRQLSKTNFQIQKTSELEDEAFATQYMQNSTNKNKNLESQEYSINSSVQNCGTSGNIMDIMPGSQSLNLDFENLQIQNLLQQQQLLLNQQKQPSQHYLTQQQNLQAKFNSPNSDVPKLSQNLLLQQSKHDLILQKQREQLQQQQQQQFDHQHQQLLLQRQREKQQQLSIVEQQKQQQHQEQQKQEVLIQQLHHQQQKEFMQQRQNLLKQQKQQQIQQHQQQQQLQKKKSFNETDRSILKSPKKDIKNFKKNFTSKNDVLTKATNSQVGVLQLTEDNNSNIGTAIDPNVLDTVAKELSNKPEFARRSVQDRLLRIRQNSNINSTFACETITDNNDLNPEVKMNANTDSKNELESSDAVICK